MGNHQEAGRSKKRHAEKNEIMAKNKIGEVFKVSL